MSAEQGYSDGMTTSTPPSPDPTTDKPPLPRRWIPLSLRMYVALLAILTVGTALWIGVPAYQQFILIQDIDRLGGSVQTSPVGPSWLHQLLVDESLTMFEKVVKVELDRKKAADGTLRQMSGLTSLRVLYLDNTQVTDAGLIHLQGMADLQALWLNQTQVTDTGLANINGLTNLNELMLTNAHVTDAGLANLQAMTKLQILSLDNTQVTDAGLVHLQGMSKLKILYLGNTQVTAAGVAKLKLALPKLRIHQ
jgi:Leucine-rich repeat (LRR) protein